MTSHVIAVAGTSHSPVVTLDPGLIWPARALIDVTNPSLCDTTGVARTYEEHVAAAAGKFDKNSTGASGPPSTPWPSSAWAATSSLLTPT